VLPGVTFSFSPTIRNWSSAKISNSLTSVPVLVSEKAIAPAGASPSSTTQSVSLMSTGIADPAGAFGTHPASMRLAVPRAAERTRARGMDMVLLKMRWGRALVSAW